MAVDWELIQRNPAAKIKPPAAVTRELQVFTPEEARQFLDAARGHRWEGIFTTAISLGLRQGEILGLLWDDLKGPSAGDGRGPDPRGHQNPKEPQAAGTASGSGRRSQDSAARRRRQELERQLAGRKWHETGFVFTTKIGTAVDQRKVRVLQDPQGREGPQDPAPRPSAFAATLLLAQGVYPKIVPELLGHSTISLTLNTYSHVLPSMNREAANQMDQVLRGPVDTVRGYVGANAGVN